MPQVGGESNSQGFRLVLFFFYFPKKAAGDHVHGSRGKSPAPRLLMTALIVGMYTEDIVAKNMITGKLKQVRIGEQQPTPLLVDTRVKLECLVQGCKGWALDQLDLLFAA